MPTHLETLASLIATGDDNIRQLRTRIEYSRRHHFDPGNSEALLKHLIASQHARRLRLSKLTIAGQRY